MENFDEIEKRLSNKLKALCNEKGEELSPTTSAPIFHQLGLLYKQKSPDKIHLIQSAALMNAAIARQPSNAQYLDDLDELCSHVLCCAKADRQDAKLREISLKVSEKVEDLRKDTFKKLNEIKNIPDDVDYDESFKLEKQKVKCMKTLQEGISESYRNIMKFISVWCVVIMGKTPCRHALVGMGSLAKKEVTPYSDFEHVIILEELADRQKWEVEHIMEYYRWFSVIFHIIVLNLQESIIPSVAIPSLNDDSKPKGDWFYDSFTTRGISFDGMMPHACKFPLGRTRKTKHKDWTTELIKPASKMVTYLQVEEDLKNGYKLADVLTRTCFVSGNRNLYEEFVRLIEAVLTENKYTSLPIIQKQIREDLHNLDIPKNLEIFIDARAMNIKRVIYRSATLFISALGRSFLINKCSSFDIIEELKDRGVFSDKAAGHFSYAIAIACQMRLRFYMDKKSQNDNVLEGSIPDTSLKSMQLVQIIGTKSLVDYMVIAQVLQTFISFQLEERLTLSKYKLDELLETRILKLPYRVSIMSDLCLFGDVVSVAEKYFDQDNANFGQDHFETMHYLAEAYKKTNRVEESLKIYTFLQTLNLPSRPTWKVEMTVHKLHCLMKLQRYDEVLQESTFIKSFMKSHEGNPMIVDSNCWSEVLFVQACALRGAERYHESLICFQDLLRLLRKSENTPTTEIRRGQTLKQVALVLDSLGRFDEAIERAREATEIFIQHDTSHSHLSRCEEIIEICESPKKITEGSHSQAI